MLLRRTTVPLPLLPEMVKAPLAPRRCGEALVVFAERNRALRLRSKRSLSTSTFTPLWSGHLAGERIVCASRGIEFACDGTCLQVKQQGRSVPAMQVRSLPPGRALGARHRSGWAMQTVPTLAPFPTTAGCRAPTGTASSSAVASKPTTESPRRRPRPEAIRPACTRRQSARRRWRRFPREWTEGDVVCRRGVMQQVTPVRWCPGQNFASPMDRVAAAIVSTPGNIGVELAYRRCGQHPVRACVAPTR